MEDQKHKGETALITGATDGIGRELANCFAKDGYDLILVSRTQEDLDAVAQELSTQYGISAEGIVADLMEPGAAFDLYEDVKLMGRQVDVLVNNAGQGVWGAFTGTELRDELNIIELNITSLVVLTKLFLKEMVARDSGKILQLASVSSKSPTPYLSVYAGTKAFIYIFTQSVINELKDSNVTMTALLPGPTDTDFFNKAGADQTVAYQESAMADPADVARDGYEALQSGESRVISGLKNKIETMLGNVMPDQAVAERFRKEMELSDESFDLKEEK
jgi:hypothetical protein